jgi:hypothetical protein
VNDDEQELQMIEEGDQEALLAQFAKEQVKTSEATLVGLINMRPNSLQITHLSHLFRNNVNAKWQTLNSAFSTWLRSSSRRARSRTCFSIHLARSAKACVMPFPIRPSRVLSIKRAI